MPKTHDTGCLVCGAPLIYEKEAAEYQCAVCGRSFASNAHCANGHFVCDECHAKAGAKYIPALIDSDERDPAKLFMYMVSLPGVAMHGPEHHIILPCVLLTAYRNNGGKIDLRTALAEAARRGAAIPGGSCGFTGVCGAASGAGIYASVLLGSDPLSQEYWALAQSLAPRVLSRIAATGGVRCCKRTNRIAIEEAVKWTQEVTGISMPCSRPACTFCGHNAECLGKACPFFGTK